MNDAWYGILFAAGFIGTDIWLTVVHRKRVKFIMDAQTSNLERMVRMYDTHNDALRAAIKLLTHHDPEAACRISQQLARATARELGFDNWEDAQPPAPDDTTPVIQ